MRRKTSVQKVWSEPEEPEETTGLDKVLNVRLPMAEKVALQQRAFQAGVSLSALVRRYCGGRKMVIDPTLGVMEHLRRGSEEVRAAHLHAGDSDQVRVHTEAALRWLREAMNLLGQG